MLPIGKLSPCNLDTAELIEKERELKRRCAELEGCLHPATATQLAMAMTHVHSYYSNLIEGHSVHPVMAEQMGLGDEGLLTEGDRASLAQAKAGASTYWEAYKFVSSQGADADLITPDFLCWLHKSYMAGLHPDMQAMPRDRGHKVALKPGEFRRHFVSVGRHVAPPPEQILEFVRALREMHKLAGETIRSAMLIHHRFTWIHPFLDGNGRVGRLLLDGLLKQAGACGSGLWSMSRGLSNHADRYKALLAAADRPPQSSYDGRGALSERDGQRFVNFMIDVALGETAFMLESLHSTRLVDRLARFCEAREEELQRAPGAAALLLETYQKGALSQGQVTSAAGNGEKRADEIVHQCIDDRLFKKANNDDALLANFPMYLVAYLFRELMPAYKARVLPRLHVV